MEIIKKLLGTKIETQATIANKGKFLLEDISISWRCKTIEGRGPVRTRTLAQWVIKGDKSRLFYVRNVMEEGHE